ncbi:Protein cbp3, mitochondrial [Tulasnella sp. 418]|nr:Protein cbp3, mitochondrial [Tulasnella sp. 418]
MLSIRTRLACRALSTPYSNTRIALSQIHSSFPRYITSSAAAQPSQTQGTSTSASESPASDTEASAPKPFPSPPPHKPRTPEWLRRNPTFVKAVNNLAWLLGSRTKTVTAIRETRWMYQACAEREVAETGFIYVECRLPPTFQTWFAFTNLHVWMLTTRLRALPAPYGRLYIQELINHFFLDIEYRLRSVFGPKVPERIMKNHMRDVRDQWNGSTASFDVALMQGDAELAAAIWRNVFAARGEKAYKEKDLPEEEKERRIEERKKNNDPEADGASLEEIPRLVYQHVAHVRREIKRLEALSDEEVRAGNLGKFGTVGVNQADTAWLADEGDRLVKQVQATKNES